MALARKNLATSESLAGSARTSQKLCRSSLRALERAQHDHALKMRPCCMTVRAWNRTWHMPLESAPQGGVECAFTGRVPLDLGEPQHDRPAHARNRFAPNLAEDMVQGHCTPLDAAQRALACTEHVWGAGRRAGSPPPRCPTRPLGESTPVSEHPSHLCPLTPRPAPPPQLRVVPQPSVSCEDSAVVGTETPVYRASSGCGCRQQ